MIKPLTAGELKKQLENVPDETEIRLMSDTGVDQGTGGEIIVESAKHIKYTKVSKGAATSESVNYFGICANEYEEDYREGEL